MGFLSIKNPLRMRFSKAKFISSWIFYITFFWYVAVAIMRDTTIQYDHKGLYRVLGRCFWYLIWLAFVNILLFADYTIGQMILYTIIGVVFWISYKNNGNPRIYQSFLILLSARNVDWKDLIKKACYVYGGLLVFTFFIYGIGYISDMAIYERGGEVRWNMGFTHPNILGGYVMLFTVLWLTAHYETLNLFDYAMVAVLAAFVWIGPASRTSAILMVLMLFLTALAKLVGRKLLASGFIRAVLILFYPLCFLGIFSLSYLYNENSAFWVKLDTLLSNRIQFNHVFLDKYLHSWFGQKIKQVSNYKSATTGKESIYLTSSYMRLYIMVGIVGCVLMLWIFTRIMSYAVENNRLDLIAGLLVMAVYGIAELYITYMHWNIFLVLFAYVQMVPIRETIRKRRLRKAEGEVWQA